MIKKCQPEMICDNRRRIIFYTTEMKKIPSKSEGMRLWVTPCSRHFLNAVIRPEVSLKLCAQYLKSDTAMIAK